MSMAQSEASGPAAKARWRFSFGVRRWDLWPSILLVVVVLASLAILVHLAVILWISFLDGPPGAARLAYGFGKYSEIFADPFTLKVLLNTLGFAMTTLVVTLGFGVPIAWLVTRSNIPGKATIATLMTVALLVPGVAPAIGWLFLLHPKIGMINIWLAAVFGAAAPNLNIGSVVGMGWVQGLNLAPLAFVMTAAVFRSMNPALEEAAAMSRANPRATLLHVTLRLAWPGILAAAIFTFTIGFAALDAPAIIGWGNRVFTYSTYMLDLLNAHGGLPDYPAVAALSAPLFLWALLMTWCYGRVQRRARRYQVVSGKAYRPRLTELGRGKWLASGFVGAYLALSVVLPLLVLVWASLLPVILPPSKLSFGLVSLAHFRQIDWTTVLTALRNTGILAVLTATIVTLLGGAFSWTILRSRVRGKALFDFLAFLPHVVPSALFSVAALLIALFVLDRFMPIYGTIWILLLAMVIVRISYGTRMTSGALLQIDRELEESAQMCGATTGDVIMKVLVPLLAPALLYTWLWTALLTCRELTVVMFLTNSDNLTLPYVIWSDLAGDPGGAAAIALLMILLMLPFVFLYAVAMNRMKLIAS